MTERKTKTVVLATLHSCFLFQASSYALRAATPTQQAHGLEDVSDAEREEHALCDQLCTFTTTKKTFQVWIDGGATVFPIRLARVCGMVLLARDMCAIFGSKKRHAV
jgi:hypothetical protein